VCVCVCVWLSEHRHTSMYHSIVVTLATVLWLKETVSVSW
jgi:hypothetical protein